MISNVKYTIEAIVSGAKHRILINDITASMDLRGTPLNSEIPVNEFLIDSLSEITIELLPLKNDDILQKKAEVSVVMKRNTWVNDNRETVVIFEHRKEVNSLTGLKLYRHSETISIEIPYGNPFWLENKVIDITDRPMLERFYASFNDIWNLFQQKRVDDILQLFDKKFMFYEKCYYLTSGDRRDVTKNRLVSTFDDPSFELVGFNLSLFQSNLFAKGKMVALLDKQGYHFIMYYSYKDRILVEFPIFLGMDQNDLISICF